MCTYSVTILINIYSPSTLARDNFGACTLWRIIWAYTKERWWLLVINLPSFVQMAIWITGQNYNSEGKMHISRIFVGLHLFSWVLISWSQFCGSLNDLFSTNSLSKSSFWHVKQIYISSQPAYKLFTKKSTSPDIGLPDTSCVPLLSFYAIYR